jgi:hypothetical protein
MADSEPLESPFVVIPRRIFGEAGSLTEDQIAVAQGIFRGEDVVLTTATGGGKSLASLLPSFVRLLAPAAPVPQEAAAPRTTVFVALTTSLQVQLAARASQMAAKVGERPYLARALGQAAHERCGLKAHDVAAAKEEFKSGSLDLAVVSPEFLASISEADGGLSALLARICMLFVMDEAHLCVEWSEFRPAIVNALRALRSCARRPPVLVMSGSLSAPARVFVLSVVGAKDPTCVGTANFKAGVRVSVEFFTDDARLDPDLAVAARLSVADTLTSDEWRRARAYPRVLVVGPTVEFSKLAAALIRAMGVPGDARRLVGEVGVDVSVLSEEHRRETVDGFSAPPTAERDRVGVLCGCSSVGVAIDPLTPVLLSIMVSPPSLSLFVQVAGRMGQRGPAGDAVMSRAPSSLRRKFG